MTKLLDSAMDLFKTGISGDNDTRIKMIELYVSGNFICNSFELFKSRVLSICFLIIG